MKAVLVLEDGTIFEGESFGAEGEAVGEVVFNTQIIGYQEILTDPAYRKQIIAMGYPHIGNNGINAASFESDQAQAAALIVKEYSKIYSNWQATGPLDEFMKKHGVIGIEGIDTRALTLHIRDNGEMKGIVSTKSFNVQELVDKAKKGQIPEIQTSNFKLQNKTKTQKLKPKTVIINIGVNNSTLAKYPDAAIVPYNITAEKIEEMKPEQVVISSGPGDPRKLSDLADEVKQLIGKVKIIGIQNGACVLALALGCSVYRMKTGHHGMNHPVVEPRTGKGEISAQNHSYGVDKLSAGMEVVYANLNDKTIEKFRTKDGRCIGTLYNAIDERGKLAPGYQRVM